ncbi:hypothetical protein SAY86_007426 [Trapa natans]|uniref:Uncharacterized protein n=1 Tax=Trapa natans TaxID=22666 RepID=A0AAN7LNZ4_TRANT|nr:hypothetical protein SAY86_007426 [Trapa natans]
MDSSWVVQGLWLGEERGSESKGGRWAVDRQWQRQRSIPLLSSGNGGSLWHMGSLHLPTTTTWTRLYVFPNNHTLYLAHYSSYIGRYNLTLEGMAEPNMETISLLLSIDHNASLNIQNLQDSLEKLH